MTAQFLIRLDVHGQYRPPLLLDLRNHVDRPLQVFGSRLSCFAGLFDAAMAAFESASMRTLLSWFD